MAQPRILMCPPDFFGIEYEINPWMSMARGASPSRARQQWQGLHHALEQLGVRVELMTPQPGLPDLVFTANAGLVYGSKFYSSRFRHLVRARETPFFDSWFAGHGFEVLHLPEGMYFEGAGDALFCDQTLFAGYRIRSDVRGHQQLARQLGVQVLPVELVDDRFYHLDTCFCPLAPGEALYYPGAFDDYGRRVMQNNVRRLLAVSDADAERFGCNAVVVGKSVVINAGCDQLAADLSRSGYTVIALELDEFLKSGGSAKCLTLRLDGEEAAGWRGQLASPPEVTPVVNAEVDTRVQHVALLRFKSDVSPSTIADCFTALRRLQQVIPGLEQFSGGSNVSSEGLSRGYTHGFVMIFEDACARDAYLPHPEHEKVKQMLLRYLDDLVVVDLQM